jgi:hypothetical protein
MYELTIQRQFFIFSNCIKGMLETIEQHLFINHACYKGGEKDEKNVH